MPLFSSNLYQPNVAATQNPFLQAGPSSGAMPATHMPLPTVPSFQQNYPGGQYNVAGGMMGPVGGSGMRWGGGGYGGPMPIDGGDGGDGGRFGGGKFGWGGMPPIRNPLLPRPIGEPIRPIGHPIDPVLPIRPVRPVWNAPLASNYQNMPMTPQAQAQQPVQYF